MIGRRWVIGDIHGCPKTLETLLIKKIELREGDELYFLGDYIHRGPDDQGVINLIMKLKESHKVVTLMGNHEQMDLYNYIAYKNKEFFKDLVYYHELKDFILVHGGFNFNNKNIFTDKNEMLWNRDCVVDLEKTGGRPIIVGHTPQRIFDVIASLDTNKILLDGGCVFGKESSKYGKLCALELNKMILQFVHRID